MQAREREQGRKRRTAKGQDDHEGEPQHGRQGVVAGLRHDAPANGGRCRHEGQPGRAHRPEDGEPPGGLCHRARRQLFRHITSILPRTLRESHRHRPEPSQALGILHRDKDVKLQS